MKNMIRLMALLLLLCGMSAALADEPLAVWPKEHAPQKIIHAGDWWYAMMGTYGFSDAELAVGPAPDALTTVYSADAHVWSFAATGSHAAWVQVVDNERLEWMLYDRASGEITQVHSEAMIEQRPCFAVALAEGRLFYCRSVGTEGAAQLIARSLTDGSEELWGEDAYPIGAMALREGTLFIARRQPDGWKLIALETAERSRYKETPLPEYIDMVYDVDYDPQYGVIAMYYMDSESGEHVALLGRSGMINLYTFSRGVCAVDDMVEVVGGRLRWCVQVNASGYVTDHYRMVDYNLLRNWPTEHLRTYWFSTAEEGVLALSFGEDRDYETCVLNVYPVE